MKKYLTNNGDDTAEAGKEFAKILKKGDVVLMFGDLGAGKTTFVQGVAEELKISEKILSPTFVLVRSHKVNFSEIKTLNHIDLYRLEKPVDILSLGIEEMFSDPESVTLVEWADRLTDFSLKTGYRIKFEYKGENKREISIETNE